MADPSDAAERLRRRAEREFAALPAAGRRRYRAALAEALRSDPPESAAPERLFALHRRVLARSRYAFYVGETPSGLARRV